MRHMEWLFDELALPSDKKSRSKVDSALRQVFGLGREAHCPEVWSAVKALCDEERYDLVPRVAKVLDTN